jgi:hypothetical protein
MAVSEQNFTTIAISKKNHQVLSELGKKGESFDSVLSHLLNKIVDRDTENNLKDNRGRVLPNPNTKAERSTTKYG